MFVLVELQMFSAINSFKSKVQLNYAFRGFWKHKVVYHLYGSQEYK